MNTGVMISGEAKAIRASVFLTKNHPNLKVC